MSFLGEIKRRKVFQVAAVYLVVSWLIMQVVDVVNEPLNLPDWFDTAVIVALGIGLPIALILAWAFDVTPEGVVRDQGRATAAPASGRRIEYVLIGLVVIALGWLVYRVEFDSGGVVGGQREGVLPNSVAVLPFENLSPDPNDAYFAAGIHESTLNQLAKIRDLTVMARTSVMQYEDNPPPIPEIAEALNVQMVMEGSVRYANDRVLIAAQLIDGQTGAHIWSREFNRDLTDIFAVQAEIAENIALALKAELLPSERQSIQKVQTSSPEAYSLYLRASNMHLSPGGTGPTDDLHQFLDQAIKLDPGFARAHALKAYDYAYAMIRKRLPDDPEVRELEQLAFEHAGRALSLDPEENLAYVSLANIHRHNWRAAEAEGAFERALELAPNDPYNLNTYSSFLSFLGKHDRAIELGLRADDLIVSVSASGRAYLAAGDFDAAYAAWNDDLRNNPADVYDNYHQAITEWHRGNEEAALANMKIAEKNLSDDQPAALARIVYSYGLIDRHEDALRLFRSLEQMAGNYHIRASSWAYAYLGIRDYEEALTWLRRIDEERSPEDSLHTFQIASNRYHDPALERPEFVDIRKSLALRQ